MKRQDKRVFTEVMLAARVDPATARAFQRISEKNERSVSGQLRILIRQFIDQYDKGDSHDISNAN